MSRDFNRVVSSFQKPRHFRQNAFIVDDQSVRRPVVYMRNHKSACTTIISTLAGNARRRSGKRVHFMTIEEVHRARHAAFLDTSAISLQDCYRKVDRDDSFVFSFVRHPLRRAASAFADKVSKSPRHRAKLLARLGRAQDEAITFADFLHALCDRDDILNLDRHWRPQHKELALRGISYDYLGAMDHLSRDLPAILDAHFVTKNVVAEDARRAFGHKTSSAALLDALDPVSRRKFETVMETDYALYEAALDQRFAA